MAKGITEISNYITGIKTVVAYDMLFDQTSELDPAMPFTGTDMSLLVKMFGNDGTFADGTRLSACRSALQAFTLVMPGSQTIRVDLTRHEREKLRAESLPLLHQVGAFPTDWNAHDLLSFTLAIGSTKQKVQRTG